MTSKARFLVATVGIFHVAFMVAEVGFWTTLVPKLNIYDEAHAVATADVGKNMGAYNGIFGVLLIWLAWKAPELGARPAKAFATWILVGVVVAGVVGGLTIKWTIPVFQSVPALIALATLWSASESPKPR
jgi:putative membrane protein